MNRKIPKSKMQEGIDHCKANVLDFLKDARLIFAEGRLNHAYVLVEFSIEEFGKVVILEEALNASKNDPITIGESVFTSHKGKSDKAWTVLDSKYRTIFDEGLFDHEIFDPNLFDTDTLASHDTRLNCAFVNFNGDKWVLGERIKPELLDKLITHIHDAIQRI